MNDMTDELVDAVLEWWNAHRYDTEGPYGEYNVYNETPTFVEIAEKIRYGPEGAPDDE